MKKKLSRFAQSDFSWKIRVTLMHQLKAKLGFTTKDGMMEMWWLNI